MPCRKRYISLFFFGLRVLITRRHFAAKILIGNVLILFENRGANVRFLLYLGWSEFYCKNNFIIKCSQLDYVQGDILGFFNNQLMPNYDFSKWRVKRVTQCWTVLKNEYIQFLGVWHVKIIERLGNPKYIKTFFYFSPLISRKIKTVCKSTFEGTTFYLMDRGSNFVQRKS